MLFVLNLRFADDVCCTLTVVLLPGQRDVVYGKPPTSMVRNPITSHMATQSDRRARRTKKRKTQDQGAPPPSISIGAVLKLAARDGYRLAATHYEPTGPAASEADAVVIISAATGVPRGFYTSYAAFLAAEGFRVLTFDYRGIGGSRPETLRHFSAQMQDWGRLDLSAAINWTAERFPGEKRIVLGHSVGGQVFGLADNCHSVQALLAVASQSGYWRHWPGMAKLGIGFFFYVLIPMLTRIYGYFPSRRFGMGENLPAGVALEWARWGRTRGYLLGALGDEAASAFERFDGLIRAYSFADDGFAPKAAVEGLLKFYPAAESEHRHVHPHQVDARAIGHFGFFREAFRDTLWRETADWLHGQVEES